MQLTVIAKERGIRGYYKLRKVELIHALKAMEATRLVEQTNNIFDESISNDPTPVLQPRHQISRRKLSKIQTLSLLRVCKRLKILVNGC